MRESVCVCQCKQVNDDNMLHRCHISLSISCSPKLKDASIKPSNESMSAFIANNNNHNNSEIQINYQDRKNIIIIIAIKILMLD